MARQARQARLTARSVLKPETTGALVRLENPEFLESDPDTIQMYMIVKFNGPSGEEPMDNAVTFALTATAAQQRNAIRAIVNDMLGQIEPGNALASNAIKVSGLMG